MYSLLMYDIPTAARVQNPSNRLWRSCIRVNLSVWVVKDEATPHNLLARMTAAGVSWHLIPFDSAADAQVLDLCREALAAEVRRVVAALRKAIDRADDKLRQDKDVKAFDRRCREAHKRAERQLLAATDAAYVFSLAIDSDGVALSLAQLHASAVARAATYASLAASLDDPRLREAAEADLLPAQVLADAVEDQTGADMSAVHAAFAD